MLKGKDVNECMIDNGGCGGYCINTNGGFYCSCKLGLSLVTPNAVTCDGKL